MSPLPDGRLVMEQYGTAIAEDATNTRWVRLRTPPGTTYAGRVEGALLAAPHRHFDEGWLVSYDAGATWQPHTVKSLLRHVLP